MLWRKGHCFKTLTKQECSVSNATIALTLREREKHILHNLAGEHNLNSVQFL